MSSEKAILAGGCFWGMEELIRNLPGVQSTRVGYTGGDVKNATYRNHDSHAEAIAITFNPTQMSYRKLLEFFFKIHNPTTKNRQGNDVGTSYRSAVFYLSEDQKKTAQELISEMNASGIWPGPNCNRSSACQRILGCRRRAPGLFAETQERLHLPLCKAGMAIACIEKSLDELFAMHAFHRLTACYLF